MELYTRYPAQLEDVDFIVNYYIVESERSIWLLLLSKMICVDWGKRLIFLVYELER